MTIFDVDRKAFIDLEHGFFYNGIGKAGHSTVIVNLAKIKFGEEVKAGKAKTSSFLKPSELNAEQMQRFDALFKFTFVRNPYSRTLSGYLDKIVRNKLHPKPLLARTSARPPSFRDFCDYLADGGLCDQHHWAPQTRLLLIPAAHFDLVGKLEDFEHDFSLVRARLLGEDLQFEVRNHDPHRTDSDKKLNEHYDDHTREIVARLYRDDFLELGYPIG